MSTGWVEHLLEVSYFSSHLIVVFILTQLKESLNVKGSM